jgi:hypothetical protein
MLDQQKDSDGEYLSVWFSISEGMRIIIIPGNHEVKELQKTAILGTTHVLRKVLM